jgi:DNA repair protein RadC
VRVFEAKIVYRLVSPGGKVKLDEPVAVSKYLQSAYDENPMQELFYAVFLDRKNYPHGRHLISMGNSCTRRSSVRAKFSAVQFWQERRR